MRSIYLLLTFVIIFFVLPLKGQVNKPADFLSLEKLSKSEQELILEFNNELKRIQETAESKEAKDLREALKPAFKLLAKWRDGIHTVRLSRFDDKFEDSLTSFEKRTGLSVYVYTYVDEPGFFNNLIKRYSELKYPETDHDNYITISVKLNRLTQPDDKYFESKFSGDVSIETDQEKYLTKKIPDLKKTIANAVFNGKPEIQSSEIFDRQSPCETAILGVLSSFNSSAFESQTDYVGFDILNVDMESITEARTYITPAGTPITLPSGIKIIDANYRGEVLSPEGVLLGFKLNDATTYIAKIDRIYLKFNGYYKVHTSGAIGNECYKDNSSKSSGSQKVWYIKRQENAKQCSLVVSQGNYNFDREYSTWVGCGYKDLALIPEEDVYYNFKPSGVSNSYVTACIDKTQTNKPAIVPKQPFSQTVGDYSYATRRWLQKTGINATVWIGDCGDNGQIMVINSDVAQTSDFTHTKVLDQIDKGTFNRNIGIYACLDKATGKWTIKYNFKKGSIKINSKLAGVTEQKVRDEVDKRIQEIIKQKTGTGAGTAGSTAGQTEYTTEGDVFKYDNLDVFASIVALMDATLSLTEYAKVPEKFWDIKNPDFDNSPVNAPALLCGAGDQSLSELTETIEFVKFGLDVATKPEIAKGLWNSLKNFKAEDIKNIAVSATGYENYAKGGCYARHQAGVHVVMVGAAVIAAGKKIAAKFKDATDALDETGQSITKSLDEAVDNVDELGGNFDFINGSKPINAKDAGKTVTTKSGFSVKIKDNGFPDFTPYSKKNVKIDDLNGTYNTDFAKANKATGFGESSNAHLLVENGKYKDYTWHHHEDGKTMQLVPRALNNPSADGLAHTGGAAVIKHNSIPGNKILNFPSPIY